METSQEQHVLELSPEYPAEDAPELPAGSVIKAGKEHPVAGEDSEQSVGKAWWALEITVVTQLAAPIQAVAAEPVAQEEALRRRALGWQAQLLDRRSPTRLVAQVLQAVAREQPIPATAATVQTLGAQDRAQAGLG